VHQFRNILVIGIGGVGGYFGGKIAYSLSQSNPDNQHITFLARGKHLEKIRNDGLELITPEGKFICNPTLATDNLDNVPIPDLVLICTKSYDLENIISQLDAIISKNTVLLPLLNGIDIVERIRRKTGNGIILPSCVYIASHVSQPGTVIQQGPYGTIISGAGKNISFLEPDLLIKLFEKAGTKFKWVEDPYSSIWEKYIFVASFAMVTAYSQKTFYEVIHDDQLCNLLKEVMSEITFLAKESGINVPSDIFKSSLQKAGNLPRDAKTSYQRDIETKGNKNEGDIFGSTIIEKGKLLHIETPVTESLFKEIQKKIHNK
jgi:2-dehydropantoate 2-reductase